MLLRLLFHSYIQIIYPFKELSTTTQNKYYMLYSMQKLFVACFVEIVIDITAHYLNRKSLHIKPEGALNVYIWRPHTELLKINIGI